jgi:hypothetical protein
MQISFAHREIQPFVLFVLFCGELIFGCGFAALGNPW